MRNRMVLLTAIVLTAGLALAQQSMQQPQQSTQQPVVTNQQAANFVSSPAMPDCYSFALVRGDPKGSGSVTLIKLNSGCTVPRHWHSANEELTFTSGTGQIEMDGGQPQAISVGTYVYNPARHVHQLTCKDTCTAYRTVDGPIDIHYVDAAGNEIAPATAVAAFSERLGSAAAQK